MNKILIFALVSLLFAATPAVAKGNHPDLDGKSSTTPDGTSSAFLSNVVSSADECGGVRYRATLTFTGRFNDGNGLDLVWFTIFDDMQEKFAQAVSAPVGQTRAFSIVAEYPGGVGAAAPGIGIYVGDTRGGGQLIQIDPYFPSPISGCSIGGSAPALAFSPTTGAVIAYSAAGMASPIAVSNGGGGLGSGPVATTTLTSCTISNGGAAFLTTSFNPGIVAIANGSPSPSVLNLPNCVPQPALVTATLQCMEIRGVGNPAFPRRWTLSCPVGVVIPPPAVQQPSLAVPSVTGGIPDAGSGSPILSRTGSKVIFNSDASNLVNGDSNGRKDVFLRDRVLGTTTRISAVAEALNSGAQESFNEPAVSPNASTVAFTGSSGQVYASVNGLGRRISASATGTPGNGPSGKAAAPGDGMLVFFDSQASNLLNGSDGNGNTKDIFVKDLNSEAVILVSRGPNDEPADGPSSKPSASADGQTIVFSTLATNIVPGGVIANGFGENFDGVTAPNLPINWSASNPVAGTGTRWVTTTVGNPTPISAPNAVGANTDDVVSDKLLVGPPLRVTGLPLTLSFQLAYNVEASFDGMVLEVSVNGGPYNDVVSSGGSFTSGGYTGVISQSFNSPIAGRNAWTGSSNSYIPVSYSHPGNALIAVGSDIRFRWRLASDTSINVAGARIDNVSSNNLAIALVQTKLWPDGVKAGTIQQVAVMRGGGFGQSRFYVSRNRTSGELGNGDSTNVKITPDGRFGVFESVATNLIDGDTNAVSDIYRFEVANNAVVSLERVSVSKAGVQANGASRNATITDDGLFVIFETDATNLATGDADGNGASDVMIKSLLSGDVVRQNTSTTGQEPNGPSTVPVVSGDGSTIVFGSGATNLTPGDTNNAADIFTSGLTTNAPQDEPGFTAFPLPIPTNFPGCPAGYFVATVSDGPGAGLTPGIFGLALELDAPGTQRLEGGLNFGGLVDGSQVAFAGFNFQNPANEPQRLSLVMLGAPSSDRAALLPVRIKVIRQPAPNVNEVVLETTTSLNIATPYTRSIDLTPGYYVVTVAPEGAANVPGGAADGEVYVSATTQFIDRPGGGFFAGAVVGGYHAVHPFGGVSGYAAICLGDQHSATARVLSAPTYGAAGARDLRLQLLDFQDQVLITVP